MFLAKQYHYMHFVQEKNGKVMGGMELLHDEVCEAPTWWNLWDIVFFSFEGKYAFPLLRHSRIF